MRHAFYVAAAAPFLLVLCTVLAVADTPETPRITVLPGAAGAWIEEDLALEDDPQGLGRVLPLLLDPDSLRTEPAAAMLKLHPPWPAAPGHLALCLGKSVGVLAAEARPVPAAAVPAVLLQAPGDRASLALVRLADGSQTVAVPPERVLCAPGPGTPRNAAGWVLELAPEAAGTRLVYRLDGWSWQARHRLELSDDGPARARLHAEALVTVPGGVAFDAARLRLLAGDVPRVRGRGSVALEMKSARAAFAAAPQSDAGGVTESHAQELLVFAVEGTVRLAGPVVTRLPLRPAHDVTLEDVIRVEAPVPHYGNEDERDLTGRRHLRFPAPEGKPLPAGVVSIGQREDSGSWMPVGEVTVSRTAPGERADLALGEAGDLVVRWLRTGLDALGNAPYRQQVELEIEVRNSRPGPAAVEVRQTMGQAFELLSATPEPARVDGTSVLWKVELAPDESARLKISARVDPRRR